MYGTSEKEKEFLNQKKTVSTESIKDYSDRELQEKQILLLTSIDQSNQKIKANLQFWFYAGIALVILSFLYFKN